MIESSSSRISIASPRYSFGPVWDWLYSRSGARIAWRVASAVVSARWTLYFMQLLMAPLRVRLVTANV